MTLSVSEVNFPKPEPIGRLTNNDILFGPTIPPIDRLKIFSPEQFENMVREWVSGYLMKKGVYSSVTKCSGAGDMGRDVIARVRSGIWDNFQCKHYNNVLMPSEINSELAKLAYYTSLKLFTLPRKFYFVSPQGAGPSFNSLLENPDELRKQLIENWDKQCKKKIRAKEEVPLTDDLIAHIEAMDFSIFASYDPQQLINEYRQTPEFATRFGGGLQKRRNFNVQIPAGIQNGELVYTSQLFEAYSDYTKTTISEIGDLVDNQELLKHFERQRRGFYSADSLNQFSRDTLPVDTDYFADLKDEFYDGIVDVAEGNYTNGFERVKATTNFAKSLSIDSNPLVGWLKVTDREGICHHLANENRLQWVSRK
jgi:hypothetical protein